MEHKNISDLVENEVFYGYYVITDVKIALAKSGNTYLTLTISDQSGKIQAIMWNYSGNICAKDVGRIVFISAEVGYFRNYKQATASEVRLADVTDIGLYSVENLVPIAPIDAVAAMDRIVKYIESIKDPDYQRIASALIYGNEEAFSTIPAGKSIHHSFLHGLLMHTLNVLDLSDNFAKKYDDVNRDLLITGALLHDIGKIQEFVLSETGLVVDYSEDGQLLGHLTMGANQVSEVAKALGTPECKSRLLQHLILSHHGTPEHGAAVLPACLESELLSSADMIDSRAEIYREHYSEMFSGEFSPFIYSLNKRIYKHAR